MGFNHARAVLIGVGSYKDATLDVPVTADEAKSMQATLTDTALAGYLPDRVAVLTAGSATRQGILSALDSLSQRSSPDDTVVLFYAGHGCVGDDGQYYLTTHETQMDGHGRVKVGTGVSRQELIDRLRAIAAQKLMVIINACLSGRLQPGVETPQALGAPPPSTLGYDILGTGEGRALLTASRPTQRSYFHAAEAHTYFGQALLDAFRGEGVENSGGFVGLFELYEAVYRTTRARAANAGVSQDPVLTLIQGVGPFPLALHQGSTPSGLGAGALRRTPPERTAVHGVPREAVQAFIGQARNVRIDQSQAAVGKVIDFGGAHIEGGVHIGKAAGRDIVEVNINAPAPAAVAHAESWDDIRALIELIRTEIAKLQGADRQLREDADTNLRQAADESVKGENRDPRYIASRLQQATDVTLQLVTAAPAAARLAEAISALVQRVTMME